MSAPPQVTDQNCDKCGGRFVVKQSRFGIPFLACENYPKCKNTRPPAPPQVIAGKIVTGIGGPLRDDLPILALVKERVVGCASLHFSERSKRHVAEVRLFLSKDYRKRGLGMKMSRTPIELARRQGVHTLVAEIVSDKTDLVKAFETLGFRQKATLDDHFMFPDGESRDVVLLTLSLCPKTDEF